MTLVKFGEDTPPTPTKYEVEIQDIDGEGTGRGETGYMDRERVRAGVYKLSLEFSSDIIYDIDLIKNSVDSNSSKWEDFFGHKIGVTEKQVFGNLSNSVHPDDKAEYDASRNRLLQD